MEDCMAVQDIYTGAGEYRVEVSGWDEEENFFVEKSQLAWNDESGKHVCLQHMLPEGSLIFVRLLQSTSMNPTIPVAFETGFLGQDERGRYQFRLNPVIPKYAGAYGAN